MSLLPSCAALELRLLPSAGITQLLRYYEPLRHPAGPSWSSRFPGWRVRATVGASRVAAVSLFTHAAASTPAEPVGARVARFPTAVSLPRINGGSASALPVSRPAQRSLRVAACVLAESPTGDPSSSECFSAVRYLPAPLRLLPAGATVAGRDSHPLGHSAGYGTTLAFVKKPLPAKDELPEDPSHCEAHGKSPAVVAEILAEVTILERHPAVA